MTIKIADNQQMGMVIKNSFITCQWVESFPMPILVSWPTFNMNINDVSENFILNKYRVIQLPETETAPPFYTIQNISNEYQEPNRFCGVYNFEDAMTHAIALNELDKLDIIEGPCLTNHYWRPATTTAPTVTIELPITKNDKENAKRVMKNHNIKASVRVSSYSFRVKLKNKADIFRAQKALSKNGYEITVMPTYPTHELTFKKVSETFQTS